MYASVMNIILQSEK